MIGQDRLHIGKGHEKAVRARLETDGWDVQEWGNGLLSDPIRNTLQHQPLKMMVRWLPDLIAVRGNHVRLVDAKTDTGRTGNFALEIDAYACHLMLERIFGIPVVYVWADFTVNRPTWLRVTRWVTAPTQVRGSGTPFVLVRCDDQLPWHTCFDDEAPW